MHLHMLVSLNWLNILHLSLIFFFRPMHFPERNFLFLPLIKMILSFCYSLEVRWHGHCSVQSLVPTTTADYPPFLGAQKQIVKCQYGSWPYRNTTVIKILIEGIQILPISGIKLPSNKVRTNLVEPANCKRSAHGGHHYTIPDVAAVCHHLDIIFVTILYPGTLSTSS